MSAQEEGAALGGGAESVSFIAAEEPWSATPWVVRAPEARDCEITKAAEGRGYDIRTRLSGGINGEDRGERYDLHPIAEKLPAMDRVSICQCSHRLGLSRDSCQGVCGQKAMELWSILIGIAV